MDSRPNSGNEKITTKASRWFYRLRRKQRVFQPGTGKPCLLRQLCGAVFHRTTQCLTFCCLPWPSPQMAKLFPISDFIPQVASQQPKRSPRSSSDKPTREGLTVTLDSADYSFAWMKSQPRLASHFLQSCLQSAWCWGSCVMEQSFQESSGLMKP